MRGRGRVPGAAALPVALLVAACGSNHADGAGSEGPGTIVAGDTVRGIVAITGADPLTTVVLRRPDGSTVAVRGALADTLRQAAGLDVRLAGTAVDGGIEARWFLVRGMDGLPAVDGVLELDGEAAVLVTADGARVRYRLPPEALRRMEGRRVWIAGEPGTEPQHWGVLEP